MLVEQLKKEQSGKRKAPDDGHEVRENNVVEDHVLDHVIGSLAEVEHLWSIAKHILTESRAAKAPILSRQFCSFASTVSFGLSSL